MTISKVIATYYASGYSLANNTNLYIFPSGGVGPSGIAANFHSTISNDGKVNGGIGSRGINFGAGGLLVNGSSTYTGAVVEGVSGATVEGAAGTIFNYGTIKGLNSVAGGGDGVVLSDGGALTNGTTVDRGALVIGGQGVQVTGALGTVANFGAIVGSVGQGVVLYDGGNITNGAVTDTAASISGVLQGAGLVFAGTVTNFGAISGSQATGGGTGVELNSGGLLTNGATSDLIASITGYTGALLGGSATVNNYGTISGVGASDYQHGLYLVDGGDFTNGSSQDRTALLQGGTGVAVANAQGVVSNFGTIISHGVDNFAAGVELRAGGFVLNGSSGDAAALIAGGAGVRLLGGYGAVENFGTITGSRLEGVSLYSGGFVTNGAATDTKAQIVGNQFGVKLYQSGSVTNFGTIMGTGIYQGEAGVNMAGGGVLINGTTRDLGAAISGYAGAMIYGGAGTVTNYGAISGLGAGLDGYGVDLKSGGVVVNGGGSDRAATIEGGYGGVVIASAAGTIKNSGTIFASTAFAAQLLSGGAVTNGSLANGAALIQGYGGLLLNGGAAANFGTISGVGDYGLGVRMFGGTVTNGAAGHSGALIEGYLGVYAATGQAATVTNFGTISGAGAYAVRFGSASDLLNVEAGSTFEGVVNGGGGTLNLASGVGTLTGLLSSGGNVTVSGSMATTTFQDFATVEVAAGATFTDSGAVTIGAAQAVNDSGTLTLGGAGKNSIVNAGLIEATGAGALALAGAVANTGTLATGGGTLTISGAVTGNGHASITGGTLDLASSFTQSVTFSGSGVLELAQSQGYTGTITGFSKTSTTSLDLADIGFVSSTEATYSGTKTGGILTVTDGTHTAHITFKGNYLTSTFVASSDGHGGTIVVDPKTKPVAALPHLFIAAMAGLGGDAVGASVHAAEAWATHAPSLVSPRTMSA